jgi:RNA polymerase sigma-70 factor (ECF subfamily)
VTDSAELVARAANGDESARRDLVVKHLPSLEAFVRLRAGAFVRARESCSDLVQSVCADVLGDLGGFEYRGEEQFRHWLFQRALHKILNKRRFHEAEQRDARRERPVDSPSSAATLLECYQSICTPSRVARGREALAEFERAFARLPEDYREAITLYRIVGLPYADIAAAMGRSEGAVRNLVYRGLARLSTLLEGG